MLLHLGLDVGSTTVKLVVMDSAYNLLHSEYKRHRSDVIETVRDVISTAYKKFVNETVTINVTGSGGMFVEDHMDIVHVQEVVAGTNAIRAFIPETDVAIELGGEDSKITYLSGSMEQRMNSICAGGTGAFIDQMGSLMKMDAQELNEESKKHEKIYPIASRCGVFAKTDIQSLMNQGATKADLAASVFQSVVNQTISNLACGRTIEGNIALLGGPLHFLSELRERFMETLNVEGNEFIIPENSQLYVAMGSAIESVDGEKISFKELMRRVEEEPEIKEDSGGILEPLFESEEEKEEFLRVHSSQDVEERDIRTYQGKCYLGIDAGSTTSKVVLLDEDRNILYTHYDNNYGRPLELMIDVLKEIYSLLPKGAEIVSSGITGYGEDFLMAGLGVDHGEVETIAHYRAAKEFEPDVDFIIDIGGQDMKAMHISDGIIDGIQLNEACSSGCGSFIATFAQSLGMGVEEFQDAALESKRPVDLGSRCTVFMNSMVKQAQKEGASVADIAAGLCYSVIKNALQKVIQLRDASQLGEKIVVQGGTFYGDGILRAFEKVSGRRPVRPSIAGLMGAYGMALIAQENEDGQSTLLKAEELEDFEYAQRSIRCGLCSNRCAMTVNVFPDGSRFISGNKCERGSGIKTEETLLPNLYDIKYDLLFNRNPISAEEAKRGRVGIPRVLNIYENFPFWHAFFSDLGFEVELSDESTRETYEKGISSITSETACYPAKISHGHIENLVEKGHDFIFFPSVFYEKSQYDKAQNHLNCPVVAGYPEVIKNNVDSLKREEVLFMNPFISFDEEGHLVKRLYDEFVKEGLDLTRSEIRQAVAKGYEDQEAYYSDLQEAGRKAIAYMEEEGAKGIVLAGRPYHIDPAINHGIPGLINSLGYVVLSEDALDSTVDVSQDLRVLDQWVYHSRLYRAAEIVGQRDDMEMVQLNSFGCGVDAVTTDQVNEILTASGKIYTVLKIDEISNLGAAKIRLRSLTQATSTRARRDVEYDLGNEPVEFTRDMNDYTILAPQMAKEHFEILEAALKSEGMNINFLPKVDSKVIDQGLKHVNNDACYPAITVVGQFMEALKSGDYDPNKVALLMTQTGGACRASNYVGFIRKALREAGYPQVPVIGLSAQGIETHSGFKLGVRELRKSAYALILGDLIVRLRNETRPYEVIKGSTNQLERRWMGELKTFVAKPNYGQYKRIIKDMIYDFENLEIKKKDIPMVGIVGEILVKYLPEANNHLQDTLEAEGNEVVISDLTEFLLYSLRNSVHKARLFGKSRFTSAMSQLAIELIERFRKPMVDALKNSRFSVPVRIEELEAKAQGIVSLGHQYGEGWLLVAEMIHLIETGAANIVCIQPFGCLPNHITGKGVIKKIREIYEEANIVAIDYDPGASEVNQVNRIKLMLSAARENLEAGKVRGRVLLNEEKQKMFGN